MKLLLAFAVLAGCAMATFQQEPIKDEKEEKVKHEVVKSVFKVEHPQYKYVYPYVYPYYSYYPGAYYKPITSHAYSYSTYYYPHNYKYVYSPYVVPVDYAS